LTLSIDILKLKTHILDTITVSEKINVPENGVLIHDLLVENAHYDLKMKGLVEPLPRVLYEKMPVIWLEPV